MITGPGRRPRSQILAEKLIGVPAGARPGATGSTAAHCIMMPLSCGTGPGGIAHESLRSLIQSAPGPRVSISAREAARAQR